MPAHAFLLVFAIAFIGVGLVLWVIGSFALAMSMKRITRRVVAIGVLLALIAAYVIASAAQDGWWLAVLAWTRFA